MASSILTVKSAQRSEFPIYSKTLDAYEAMPSLIYLIFCITIGVLAEFDPTITSLTDITHTVFTTLPLSPEDPNYVYQDRDESIDESNADETLEKRTPPIGIHVCEYPNWAGKCAWQPFKDGACLEYPWESGASIGPTTGIQCKFYYGPKCGPGDRTDGGLTYPGTPNLGRLYPNAKVPLGYRCRRCASNDLCLNNKGPGWPEAIMKGGYGAGEDGMCSRFEMEMRSYSCVTTLAPMVVASRPG